MERERSLSSSSSDSWSLLEEIDDENEQQEMNEEKQDSMPPLPSDPNVCPAQIGQMDPLESISSVQLPLDLSTALLASSQHLLVVTTPASSSIVTHSGAILSPEQSAQALASDPNSPVLVSPPKSPPIESTFTFLKDPKLRISFSDSCESKEEEGGDEGEKGILDNIGNGENCTEDEEVFEQSPTPNEPHLPIEVQNLAKEITEMVEIEIEKAEQELGREKVVMMNLERAKMSTKEIEAKIGGEEEESSESESILCGGQNSAESISSSRIAEYSSTNSNGSEENSTQLDSESEIEEEEEKGREEELMGNVENEGEIESSTISSIPSSMLSSTSPSISPISMAEEGETPSILPSLPDSLPSSLENHSERLEMNDSSSLEGNGEFVEGGWTELSISSLSAYSSDEGNNLGPNSEAENGDGKGNEGQMVGGMDAAEMVARRFDELSEQVDESIWQRFLDETFGSLKNFERSDRIINILIIAMFLTSISSMTILHILENTWIGSNISNSMQSSPSLIQSPIQPAATEFRADSRQVDDKWNSELRQCKDELIEAKHAYESKAKLLHYVRFKEMEQEALVEELRKELETAKFALDNLQQKQQILGGQIPIFHLDDSTENEGKMGEMDLKGTIERRNRKRRAMRNAVERATKGPNVDGAIRPEEYAGEQSGMPTKPTAILAPMIWPGIMEIGGGRLIAPPAELDSQLVPPPVLKNQKKFEDKAIDVQEDLNPYWPSQFMPIIFDDPIPSTSDDYDQNAENENEPPECSEQKRAKMEEEDEEEDEEEKNVFGTKMFTNWGKYNEILQNLSTQSGRTHMLRSVRNAVVARLNRTIEKTTTALAAATKLVTSENFGPNLLSSTVKEVMARMENSGLSHIVDCLNNGIQRIQNIQLCIPQFVDWPIGEEEEEEEENEELEEKLENEDEEKMDENGEENDENDEQYCKSKNKMEEEEMERNDGKNEENEEPAEDDSSEGKAMSSGSGVWLLQRATARAALRHQSMDQGGAGSLIFVNRTRFSRWLFARAALRQKQRKEQRNGTTESETRSSLFRDDWMFARQKIRAKLRGKQRQNGEEAKENWFFVRQKMREKAREEGREEEENEDEELENGENNWLFGRQKLRKMREEEEERNLWPSDSEEEEEEGPKKKRKWWRKKQQKKKWKKQKRMENWE